MRSTGLLPSARRSGLLGERVRFVRGGCTVTRYEGRARHDCESEPKVGCAEPNDCGTRRQPRLSEPTYTASTVA